jgi:hypothetical protein
MNQPTLHKEINSLAIQYDESIIHANKYRFPEFYYEELDKLHGNYYTQTTQLMSNNFEMENENIPEEDDNNLIEPNINIFYTASGPVNIPRHPIKTPLGQNTYYQDTSPKVNRYSLDSLNMSLSPPLATVTPSSVTNSAPSDMLDSQQSTNSNKDPNTILLGHQNNNTYIASTNHQMIVKRVYDNYLSVNLDFLQFNPVTNQPNTIHPHIKLFIQDFITDQLEFLVGLQQATDTNTNPNPNDSDFHCQSDPFNLFNISTIGLLFDRMAKHEYDFKQAHSEICNICNGLSNRVLRGKSPKIGMLDSCISIIRNCANDILQPNALVASILVKSMSELITWTYRNYSAYWMPEIVIKNSLKLAGDLAAKLGPQIVTEIYATIKKYIIPSYIFSVSRSSWKFTHTHKQQISKLRSLVIPQSATTKWILKCIDHARQEIPWVYPDSPQIRNIIVFIDGRNWFYSEEYDKTSGGINLELLRQFLTLPEYHMTLADLVYGRISSIMTAGRQLNIRDHRYIIPVCVFNERFRHYIQPLVPSNRTVLYSPRGQDDDLLTLYLWLSNPGSFIASNDNFGNHVARIFQTQGHSQNTHHTQHTQNKYYEGLWAELIKCFKLTFNPRPNNTNIIQMSHPISKQNISRVDNFIPGTSAPF